MSRPLTVLIPAAGESRRFAQAGIQKPKGLIRFQFDGQPVRTMVENVVRIGDASYTRAYVGTSYTTLWKTLLANTGLQLLDVGRTYGQSDTLLRMLKLLTQDASFSMADPVLVLNSDNGFTYPLNVFVKQCQGFHSGALVFNSDDRAYSYVSNYPLFRKAVEKDNVSRWAMAGAYFWKSAASLLLDITDQIQLGRTHNNEYYLSGAFDHGYSNLAVAIEREQWLPWGTPEDLARDPRVKIWDEEVEDILKELR